MAAYSTSKSNIVGTCVHFSSEISTKVTLEKPNGKGFEFGAHPNAIEDGEEGQSVRVSLSCETPRA